MPQDEERRGSFQLVQPLPVRLFLPLQRPHHLIQSLLDVLSVLPERLLFLRIERVELLLRQGLPGLPDGQEGEPSHRGLDLEPLRLRLPLERLQKLLLLLLDFFGNDVSLLLVLLRFEDLRDLDLQVVDELLHVLLELDPPPGLKPDRDGIGRIPEVVDVAPVRGDDFRLGLHRDEGANGRGLAGPAVAENIDVEPGALQFQAEIDRVQGPLLADNPVQRGKILGRPEGKKLRVTAFIEVVRGQGPCHAPSRFPKAMTDPILSPTRGRG